MEIVKELTIGGMLEKTVNQYPHKNAVEYLGKSWSYEELWRITTELALGFLELGMEKGSKAGIWANDCPNTLFCFLALERIGCVPVFLNTSWKKLEVQSRMEETDVEYLLYDEGYRDVDFVEVCRELSLPMLRKTIYIGQEKRHTECELAEIFQMAAQSKEDLRAATKLVGPEDVDMILFTSGSTSTPKGVVTTHFSRVNIAYAQAEMVRATSEDVFCVTIPIFHCFSMSGNILAALAVGACICFPKNRRTGSIFQAVQQAGCTVLTAVPTLYSAMLANPNGKNYDLSSLRVGLIGGAGYAKDFFHKVSGQLDMILLPSLGQTEATAGVTAAKYTDTLQQREDNVGFFLEHLEGKIVDLKTGRQVQRGQQGEICIRGYNVMKGYYHHFGLTTEVIDTEGFLHTGDLGYQDLEGRIHLTGRSKELIIRGGENVAPGEIEDVIRQDGRVALVKVIGVPDAHYGEEICACVECVKDCSMKQQEIQELVAKKLAAYKVPKYVFCMEKMPLMGNGKIDTMSLKKYVTSRLV